MGSMAVKPINMNLKSVTAGDFTSSFSCIVYNLNLGKSWENVFGCA